MEWELVQRAHCGDLSGIYLAGLVRMSFESELDTDEPKSYRTGRDIKGRDEQTKDCLRV